MVELLEKINNIQASAFEGLFKKQLFVQHDFYYTERFGVRLLIKWPNDLTILCDISASLPKPIRLIIGDHK